MILMGPENDFTMQPTIQLEMYLIAARANTNVLYFREAHNFLVFSFVTSLHNQITTGLAAFIIAHHVESLKLKM